MSRNGKLIAYSTPPRRASSSQHQASRQQNHHHHRHRHNDRSAPSTNSHNNNEAYNIKQLKSEAAVISMAWKSAMSTSNISQSRSSTAKTPGSGSITIKFPGYNIVVRAIQSNLLIVLVGFDEPSSASSGLELNTDVEEQVDSTSEQAGAEPSSFEDSDGRRRTRGGDFRIERRDLNDAGIERDKDWLLDLQIRKLDNMTEVILAEAKYLEMPEDGQYELLLR